MEIDKDNLVVIDKCAIIGDIHGEAEQLERLLEFLDKYYPSITIFSTGDLVDRGPDSKKVIDICIERDIKAVCGNHDDAFRRALRKEKGAIHCHINPGMRGMTTVNSYIKIPKDKLDVFSYLLDNYTNSVPKMHQLYLESLPFYYWIETPTESYFLSHAGLNSFEIQCLQDGSDSWGELEESMLWVHKYPDTRINGSKQIIGHLPLNQVSIKKEHIMVDTGCGKGGALSCVILPEEKVITVHPLE